MKALLGLMVHRKAPCIKPCTAGTAMDGPVQRTQKPETNPSACGNLDVIEGVSQITGAKTGFSNSSVGSTG